MDFDPKKLAQEAQEKMGGLGGIVDAAKDKVGDLVDKAKEGGMADGLKEKAADVINKGADALHGLADKLKH
ncbi:MAG: hypothetical protein HDR80_01985 [Bacteroides sp.]|nr:hypothetical protein [Bacteroides sp.]